MSNLTIAELVAATVRAIQAALAREFRVTSCETFAEDSYCGGFKLVLSHQGRSVHIRYADMQMEIRLDGKEVFGNTVHTGFEGNMFAREHLNICLPRIAFSAAAASLLSG